MKKFLSILFIFTLMSLQGCNNEQPTQESQYVQPQQFTASGVSPANQPQVVYQQAPQEDHTIRDGLIVLVLVTCSVVTVIGLALGLGWLVGKFINLLLSEIPPL